jgi:hypothetical protein
MNKEAALERLTKLESEASELRKIIEKPEQDGLWEPAERGEKYWFITRCGGVDYYDYYDDSVDFACLNHGNMFRTLAIAKKAAELQRAYNHLLRAVFQADPNAGEWSESRRIIVYRNRGEWLSAEVSRACNDPCVHTFEQAKEACRLMTEWQAQEDAKR